MKNEKLLSEFKQYISDIKSIQEELFISETESYEFFSETAEYILKDFMLWKTDKQTWLKDWRD